MVTPAPSNINDSRSPSVELEAASSEKEVLVDQAELSAGEAPRLFGISSGPRSISPELGVRAGGALSTEVVVESRTRRVSSRRDTFNDCATAYGLNLTVYDPSFNLKPSGIQQIVPCFTSSDFAEAASPKFPGYGEGILGHNAHRRLSVHLFQTSERSSSPSPPPFPCTRSTSIRKRSASVSSSDVARRLRKGAAQVSGVDGQVFARGLTFQLPRGPPLRPPFPPSPVSLLLSLPQPLDGSSSSARSLSPSRSIRAQFLIYLLPSRRSTLQSSSARRTGRLSNECSASTSASSVTKGFRLEDAFQIVN